MEKNYWQGLIEQQISNTVAVLDEIKSDVKDIKKEMGSLSMFKAKVYGVGAVWGLLLHIILKRIF